MTENLSFLNATRLAEALKAYWRQRGYRIQVRLEAMRVPEELRERQRVLYAVRSNLVRGLPPAGSEIVT